MKSSKGLTLVEMLVVVAILGMVIALSWGPIFSWPSYYRFEATGRAFINAAQAARIQAISGLPVLAVRQSPASGIQGSQGNKSIRVFLDTITFTCDTCGTAGDRKPTQDELPIKVDDYVELVGFNQPDYLNGNLFRVTALNPANPTVNAAVPSTDTWGHLQWQITGLSFDCESCADEDTSHCVKWTDTTANFNLTTGKVKTAAAVKFIKNTVLPADQRVAYSIVKNKTGSTVECYYDPDFFDIKVRANGMDLDPYDVQRGGTTYSKAGYAIVFDFAGATRNHVDYLIGVAKKKKGEIDTKTPAITFNIDPSGRIRLGMRSDETPLF